MTITPAQPACGDFWDDLCPTLSKLWKLIFQLSQKNDYIKVKAKNIAFKALTEYGDLPITARKGSQANCGSQKVKNNYPARPEMPPRVVDHSSPVPPSHYSRFDLAGTGRGPSSILCLLLHEYCIFFSTASTFPYISRLT